jgi:hypothetical protein
MREYGKVYWRYWTSDTGRKIRGLGRDELALSLFLITAPGSSMIGLYHMPIPTMAFYLEWDVKGIVAALRRLGEIDFCHYDQERALVWVPEMAAYQIEERLDPKDKRVKWIHDEWQQYRKTPFYSAFWKRYHEAFHLPPLENDAAAELPFALVSEEPKSPQSKSARPRVRDELFDALAELTNTDPKTSGAYIGKVAAALRSAEPPYSAEELRTLPAVLEEAGLSVPFTLGVVEKYIGWTRSKPRRTSDNGTLRAMGADHRVFPAPDKYAGIEARALGNAGAAASLLSAAQET